MTDKEIEDIRHKFELEDATTSFQDYKKHVRTFGWHLVSGMTEEEFDKFCREYWFDPEIRKDRIDLLVGAYTVGAAFAEFRDKAILDALRSVVATTDSCEVCHRSSSDVVVRNVYDVPLCDRCTFALDRELPG